ncbi:MAG: hypothetical protein AB1403_16625 [Candidatus Riflebacteria bacterium]
MHRGYVSVWRKILENPAIMKDPDHLAVWMFLLLNATHKEIRKSFDGRIIALKPGQLITGRNKISSKSGVHRSKVERILKTFENEQQIEQQTCFRGRLITVVSWNKYQQNEQQNERQVSSKRAASEQQVSTNNNVNNENNKHPPSPQSKKSKSFNEEFEKFWDAYPKQKGKGKAWAAFSEARKKKSFPHIQSLLDAIERQKNEEAWKKENGRFIPEPASWIQDERWMDSARVKVPKPLYDFPF